MMGTAGSERVLRYGLIGCGWFGGVHVERLSGVPGVQLAAVSDPDPGAMERLLQRADPACLAPGGAGMHADWKELVARADLDFVSINSPNRWHVPQLLAALASGHHVLCEKPLSLVPAEVESVVQAQRASGLTVAVAYQSRYRLSNRLLRSALRSGRWGRITSIDVYACEDWVTPNVGTWRHDPARCPGGYFGDANGHQLDVLFWMTGLEAVSVQATMEQRGTPVPIVTWGEARLAAQSTDRPEPHSDGALRDHPTIRSTADAGVPFTFTFVGDAKSWREEIGIQTEGAEFVMRDTRLVWTDDNRGLKEFPLELADPREPSRPDLPDSWFVAALRGGEPVLSAPETVWPVLKFTLAALESAIHNGTRQTVR